MDGDERSQANGGKARRKPPLAAGLHIVATPIGNMRDITLRALDVLGAADLIACEDTRVFAKLASHPGLSAPTVAYSDAPQEANEPRTVRALAEGKRVALVSDAGMPLISDPGYRLVRAAIAGGHAVTSAPGPSAVPMALALSGLPTDRFFFGGFLPVRTGERRRAIAEAAEVPATLVFFEAPHRLAAALADLAELLGARPAVVARELTKLFEEVRRASLPELAAHYAGQSQVKGEIVLVIGPPGEAAGPTDEALTGALREALAGASLKDAATEVAARFGLRRRDVYARALELKREGAAAMSTETRQKAHRPATPPSGARCGACGSPATDSARRCGRFARSPGARPHPDLRRGQGARRSRDRGLLAPRPPVRASVAGGQPVRGASSTICRSFAALRCHTGGWPVAAPSAGRMAGAGVARAA
jgi:16S rRNA (cytidine1402-2'-O)-methyltransferase